MILMELKDNAGGNMGKSWADDSKLFDEYRKLKFRCRHCGHNVIIHGYMDKNICTWCGHYVFRTQKDEFKFRVGKAVKNGD